MRSVPVPSAVPTSAVPTSPLRAPARRAAIVLAVLMASFAVLIAALLPRSGAADAAPAYPPSASCSLAAALVASGSGRSVTLTGSGFPAHSAVRITLHSGPSLGSTRTDATGAFVHGVILPASAHATHRYIQASAGTWSCSALVRLNPDGGGDGTHVGSAMHDTTGVGTGGNVPLADGGQATAYTGFAATSATVLAVGLLGGGVFLLVLGRRRSSTGK